MSGYAALRFTGGGACKVSYIGFLTAWIIIRLGELSVRCIL